jgi:hypothetical protein
MVLIQRRRKNVRRLAQLRRFAQSTICGPNTKPLKTKQNELGILGGYTLSLQSLLSCSLKRDIASIS